MAQIPPLRITIVGAGSSIFGLRVLGFVARIFRINLKLKKSRKRKHAT